VDEQGLAGDEVEALVRERQRAHVRAFGVQLDREPALPPRGYDLLHPRLFGIDAHEATQSRQMGRERARPVPLPTAEVEHLTRLDEPPLLGAAREL
jgi:hypothetical protein